MTHKKDKQRKQIEVEAEIPAAEEDVSGHAIVLVNGRPFDLPDRNPVPPTRAPIDGPRFDPPRLPGQPRAD